MSRALYAGLGCAVFVVLMLGTHVTRWSGLDGLWIPGIVIGAAVVLLFVGVRRVGGGGSAYRTVHGHSATWKAAAAHEAAHAAVARHVGAADVSARINSNGSGWTSYRPPDYMTPAEEIAIALAGGMGEGVSFNSPPCRGDKAHANRVLRRVGWFSQGSTMAKAQRLAAHGLRAQSGYVKSTERKLLRSGRTGGWW